MIVALMKFGKKQIKIDINIYIYKDINIILSNNM